MSKKTTTVPKNPKIVKVEWSNYDEWENEAPRRWSAWVSDNALKGWLDGLKVTESWDVEVSN